MAMTSTHAPMATAGQARSGAGTPTFASVVRSEFTKIRSVRSTYWTLLVLVIITVGFGALASFGATRGQHGPFFDATQRSLGGLYISQLVIGVLGVLVISSEYSTGMIRTSLSVLPQRGIVYTAKALVFTVVALVAGLVTSFGSYFLGQAIFATQHLNSNLGQPGVLRAVIGGGLFLGACGLLSYGIGALLRHTAGAITASVALLFVLFVLSGFLPNNWAVHVDKWIPFNAGGAIWENLSGVNMFSPWAGFGVFCCYAAAAVIGGGILFRTRDA